MKVKEKSNDTRLLTDKQYQILVGIFGVTLVVIMNYCLIYLINLFRG